MKVYQVEVKTEDGRVIGSIGLPTTNYEIAKHTARTAEEGLQPDAYHVTIGVIEDDNSSTD